MIAPIMHILKKYLENYFSQMGLYLTISMIGFYKI